MDQHSQFWLELLGSYGAGFLASLTPCVYPLIPITLAVCGVRENDSRRGAFLRALCYVFGLCLSYSVLGFVAASSGHVFGAFLGESWVAAFLSLFFALMALHSLELFEIPFLHTLQSKASSLGGKSHFGIFLMGAVSGCVAAPCVGPVLAGILAYVGTEGDGLKGMLLLFAFSLGLGTLFLLLGTFSGLLSRIPRSGNWMYAVKFLIATLLLSAPLYLFSGELELPNFSLSLFVLILFLIMSVPASVLLARSGKKFVQLPLAILAAFSLYWIFTTPSGDLEPASTGGRAQELHWISNVEEALVKAKKNGSLILVDVAAEWCAACKELDKQTFSNPLVQKSISEFILLRIDFTSPGEQENAFASKYDVVGLPLVFFIDTEGQALPGSRLNSFLSPKDFLDYLAGVRSKNPKKFP